MFISNGCSFSFLFDAPTSLSLLSLPALSLAGNDFLLVFSFELFMECNGRKTEDALRHRRSCGCKCGCLNNSAACYVKGTVIRMDCGGKNNRIQT
jgi:hypothetical protein